MHIVSPVASHPADNIYIQCNGPALTFAAAGMTGNCTAHIILTVQQYAYCYGSPCVLRTDDIHALSDNLSPQGDEWKCSMPYPSKPSLPPPVHVE
jgi:hypothetical protein